MGHTWRRKYRFHAEQRWWADFTQLQSRCLIEVEGGIWLDGGHNRAAGFNANLDKYLQAGLALAGIPSRT